MEFKWSPKKAAINLRDHKVSFDEAATVFTDFFSMTYPDPDHSTDESRYITIGESYRGRLLFVSHAERGQNRIRIISARKATRHERKEYEEFK